METGGAVEEATLMTARAAEEANQNTGGAAEERGDALLATLGKERQPFWRPEEQWRRTY